jgi:hypothetical protein
MPNGLIDVELVEALMPFTPQVKRKAMLTMNGFIQAVNAGDDETADAIENEIAESNGEYGKALNALLCIVNGGSVLTTERMDALIAEALQ